MCPHKASGIVTTMYRIILPLLLLASPPPSSEPASLASKLEARAAAGSAEAAYHLGMLHHLGLGVSKDPRRAYDLFRQAADAGDPLGAYKLGCYLAGQEGATFAGTPEEAMTWKRKAAEAGYALAQLEMAQLHARRGELPAALPWLRRAAEQGDVRATLAQAGLVLSGSAGPEELVVAYAQLRSTLGTAVRSGAIERRALDDLTAPFLEKLDKAALARAEAMATGLTPKPTPVTVRANAGLGDAERVAAGE